MVEGRVFHPSWPHPATLFDNRTLAPDRSAACNMQRNTACNIHVARYASYPGRYRLESLFCPCNISATCCTPPTAKSCPGSRMFHNVPQCSTLFQRKRDVERQRHAERSEVPARRDAIRAPTWSLIGLRRVQSSRHRCLDIGHSRGRCPKMSHNVTLYFHKLTLLYLWARGRREGAYQRCACILSIFARRAFAKARAIPGPSAIAASVPCEDLPLPRDVDLHFLVRNGLQLCLVM